MRKHRFFSVPFVVVLSLLIAAAVGMDAARAYYKLQLKKLPIYAPGGRLLSSMPLETRSWICTTGDQRETAEVEKTLGTTNYISRYYQKKVTKGEKPISVIFHAAYYTGMIDTVPHVPDRCFIASGMQLGTLTQDIAIPLDPDYLLPDPDVPDNLKGRIFKMRVSDGTRQRLPRDPQDIQLHAMQFLDRGRPLYAGYFFIANGGCVPRAEDVRLLAFDLRATYAYYIKVQFTSADVESQQELADVAGSMLEEMFGDLMRCAPDWVEVEAGRYPPPQDANDEAKATGTEH